MFYEWSFFVPPGDVDRPDAVIHCEVAETGEGGWTRGGLVGRSWFGGRPDGNVEGVMTPIKPRVKVKPVRGVFGKDTGEVCACCGKEFRQHVGEETKESMGQLVITFPTGRARGMGLGRGSRALGGSRWCWGVGRLRRRGFLGGSCGGVGLGGADWSCWDRGGRLMWRG